MRIVVTHPQVPFAHGGAEVLAERLTEELNERGHQAALVTVPFKWYPRERVLESAFVWRMLDLTEVEGRKVDLLIATKFPSYAVRHPRKRVWLVHQFRQAYDLDRTDLAEFGESAVDRATRRAIHELDRRTLGEAEKRFAISQNVADRLSASLGLDAEVVLPPPQELDYRFDEYGDFVLSVGRLDRAKRVDLLLEAAAADPALRVVVAGNRPRPRAPRAGRGRPRLERPRRVPRPRRRRRARRPLRPLRRRLLRAGRRGLRDGPLRGVPLGQARGDDDGRGRPARRRRRPPDRAS